MPDQFDIFAACLNAIESGRATVEDCAARYPEIKGLGNKLRLALAMRAQPPVKMAEVRKVALERRLTQLMEEHNRRARQTRPGGFWVRRLVTIAAVLVVLAISGAGLAQLSRGAAPGDVLYGYKRVVERVELAFASAHPDFQQAVALRRVDELKIVATRGQTVDQGILDDLVGSLNTAIRTNTDRSVRAELYNKGIDALRFAAQLDPANLSKFDAAIQAIQAPTEQSAGSVTPTPTHTPTATETPHPTVTSSATPTATGTPQPTYTPSFTPTTKPTTLVATTPVPIITSSPAPSATPTNTSAPTQTPSHTAAATWTATLAIATPVPFVPTITPPPVLPTDTLAPTATPSPTETATETPTITYTPSATPTLAPCGPTAVPVVSASPDASATPTPSPTPCASLTPTSTATLTPSQTPSPTETATLTPSATATETPPEPSPTTGGGE